MPSKTISGKIQRENLMNKSAIPFFVLVLLIACSGNQGESGKTLARIDGKSFTAGDFDQRLQSVGESRRNDVLANPDERRKEFNRILRAHLGALSSQRNGYAAKDSLKLRFALYDQRVKTQYYFDTYLNEHDGHTVKELEAYYRAHPAQFRGDSGKAVPFLKAMPQVADSM